MVDEARQSEPARRRRMYLIDREFQYAYMTTWFLMTAGFVAATFAVLYWVGHEAQARIASPVVMEEVTFLVRKAAIFVILLTIFMGCYFLLMAHRIAGPAYRLRKCLERMSRGDYDFEVSLRKRDYLRDVADAMNVMLAGLRERRDRAQAVRDAWRKVADWAAASPEGKKLAAEIEGGFEELLRVEPAGDETKAVLVPEPPGH